MALLFFKSREVRLRVGVSLALAFIMLSVVFVALVFLPTTGKMQEALAGPKRILIKIAPQGWGFFTRSARDAIAIGYTRSSTGEWIPLRRTGLGPETKFGMSRLNRKYEVELREIANQIEEKDWWVCTEKFQACTAKLPSQRLRATNAYRFPGFCGEVLIKIQEPVPMEWAGFDLPLRMELALVDINCAT